MLKYKFKRLMLRLFALLLSLSILAALPYSGSRAGYIDDGLNKKTGMGKTPAVVFTELGVKPGANYVLPAVGQKLLIIGKANINKGWKSGTSLPYAGVGQFTAGAFLYNGMLVLSIYDNVNATIDMSNLNPEYFTNKWTTGGAVVDKVLQGADVGLGWYVIYGSVGAIAAGAGIIGTAPVSATTLATIGTVRIGLKVTRALYNEYPELLKILEGLGKPQHPAVKIPEGMIYDPLGLLGATPSGGPGALDPASGGWIPIDSVIIGEKGNPVNPFKLNPFGPMNRLPYENGVPNGMQPIADPSATGVAVYKPNIYLYSMEDKSVLVKLPYESMITKSEPAYPSEKGWQASIRSGSLNGNGDYLFYEATVPGLSFQKTYGWRVRGVWSEADMESILDKYGFNPKEKGDFLQYWGGKLIKGMDYVFHPQETDTVDKEMPLVCEPAMKNCHRIWFYIVPDSGQAVEEPTAVEAITDRSDTLVEWGGVLGR